MYERALNQTRTGDGAGWTGRRDDSGAAGRCPGGKGTDFDQLRRDGDNRLGDGVVDQAVNCFSASFGEGNSECFWFCKIAVERR